MLANGEQIGLQGAAIAVANDSLVAATSHKFAQLLAAGKQIGLEGAAIAAPNGSLGAAAGHDG